MRNYLLQKKEDIKNLDIKERFIKFNPTKNLAISVIGPRRAGKTFSLFHFIKTNDLKDEDYLFINFEDDEIKEKKKEEIRKAVFYHSEIYGKEPRYIFLDEIQALEGWQSFLYSLIERKRYYVFLTGSSSKLLSKEIATQLRGRSLTTLVLPFSFKEILNLEKFEIKKEFLTESQKSKIKNILRKYLKEGGFPDVVLTNINRSIYFRDYVNLVLFKDIVERFKIRNIGLIRMFLTSILPSFSSQFSIQKIYNTFKSRGIKVSKKTLYKYMDSVEDAFFCFLTRKFSFSERESLLSIPKIYFNDTGLITYSISTKIEEDLGRLMENSVFLELKRNESEGSISKIFYFKDYQQREVDFVVKQGFKVSQLIQVTYASSFDEIDRREIRSLLKASEIFKKDKPTLLVITWDYEDEKAIKGKKISFIPLWKWLLEIS